MKLNITLSIVIDKPVREVFERFADPEFNTAIEPGSQGATLVSGQPFTQGMEWRLALDTPWGGTMHQTQRFPEFHPPDWFRIELEQTGFSGYEDESFKHTADGKVEVTWDAHWDVRWWLVPVYPLLRRMVRTGAEHWLELMKEAIESGHDPREKA